MRYAASDILSTLRLKPVSRAAATSAACGIISKALTRSKSAAALSLPSAAAASAAKEASHAARCAPMPRPPKNSGPAVSCSHSLATHDLAFIQMRITDGNSPMGRWPPPSFGRSTICTSESASSQVPAFSAAVRMSASSCCMCLGSRSTARGEKLSAPNPVPIGKEAAAREMSSAVSGSRDSCAIPSKQGGW